MTVPSQTSRDAQAGNGVTTAFTVPFRILEAAHLRVLLTTSAGVTTEQVFDSDYTVSGVGDASTTVTFATAPASGATITFLRNVPFTQETDYVPNDPFPAESHERALDKLTMQVQQLNEVGGENGRTIKIPAQVSGVSTTMPVPVPATFWGWNEAGTAPKLYTIGDIATTAVFQSWQAQTFTGDGVTTEFTLAHDPANIANLDVSIDGVTQVPTTDYGLLGTALSFTVPPAIGAVILARYGQAVPEQASVSSEIIETAVTAGQTVVAIPGSAAVGQILMVFYNGIVQHPSAYSVAGATVTFTEALPENGSVAALVANVPANNVSGGNIGVTAAGAGAVTRTAQAALRDVISADGYATPADAVAQAVAVGGGVYWPAGSHAVTGSVPNLWDVEHTGPGKLTRGVAVIPFSPKETDAITLYVDPTGSDANDGITSDFALATVQRAIDIFVEHGSRGRWTIQLAAGTYAENVAVSSMTPMEFPLDIRGPSVGGHPNVPTAILQAASPSTDALSVSDGAWVRVYDVLIDGCTSAAAINVRRGRVTMTNVHTTNSLRGAVVQHGAHASISGGIWDGNNLAGGIGYNGLYSATHSITGTTGSDGLLIQNFVTGMQLQEGAQGHLDFSRIHDCTTGLILRRGAGACNTDSMQIYRCGVGLLAQGSGWFNNGIDFGTGADSCTINVRTLGGAPEFDYRSADYSARTKRLQESVYGVSHTGTTAPTAVYEFAGIRPWMVSEGGDSTEIIAVLSNAASAGTISVSLFLWDGTSEDFLSGVVLPVGTTTAQIRALVNFSGAADQRCSVSAIHNAGASTGAYGTGALNLKGKSGSIRVKVTLSNAADTATFQTIEVHTTLGG